MKKVLIGIILLCLAGAILFLTTKNIIGTTETPTYQLRSFTTSKTFYITGPKGYKYNEDRTGIWNSNAIFDKSSKKITSLTYTFESSPMNEVFERRKRISYEGKLDSNYYKNLTWQDAKTLTVNDTEITYVKITYNNGSEYYNDIYSLATIHGWQISCEITQSGESAKFDSDSKLLNEAWQISFTENY